MVLESLMSEDGSLPAVQGPATRDGAAPENVARDLPCWDLAEDLLQMEMARGQGDSVTAMRRQE
jgi:hypothetical protein